MFALHRREKRGNRKSRRENRKNKIGADTVLSETFDIDKSVYQPRTNETKQAYELLLATLTNKIGYVQQGVLKGAADEVLASLKNDNITVGGCVCCRVVSSLTKGLVRWFQDPERKGIIESIVGKLDTATFSSVC